MTSKYDDFVHAYDVNDTDGSERTHYAVCEWVERANQYQWPLPAAVRSGGAHTGFARHVRYSDWRYRTRAQALRAAQRLYGERIAWEAEQRSAM